MGGKWPFRGKSPSYSPKNQKDVRLTAKGVVANFRGLCYNDRDKNIKEKKICRSNP